MELTAQARDLALAIDLLRVLSVHTFPLQFCSYTRLLALGFLGKPLRHVGPTCPDAA